MRWIRRVKTRFRQGDEVRNLKLQRYENMEWVLRREEKRKIRGKGKSEKI